MIPTNGGRDEKFDALEGIFRWEYVKERYMEKGDEYATIFLWDADGNQTFTRHGMNPRKVSQNVVKISEKILRKGLNLDMCGRPVVVAMPDGTYLGVGGATRLEACYVAHRANPHSPFVQHFKRFGVKPVLKLKADTPEYVSHWVVKEHNNYHDGARFTLGQAYDTIPAAEAAWRQLAREKDWKSDNCPKTGRNTYQKLYCRWFVEEYCEEWCGVDAETEIEKSEPVPWIMFTKAKAGMHNLERLGVWKVVYEDISKHCKFTEPKLDNLTGIQAIHQTAAILEKIKGASAAQAKSASAAALATAVRRCDYMSADQEQFLFPLFANALIACVLPMAFTANTHHSKPRFWSLISSDDLKKLLWLLTPLADSKMYEKRFLAAVRKRTKRIRNRDVTAIVSNIVITNLLRYYPIH